MKSFSTVVAMLALAYTSNAAAAAEPAELVARTTPNPANAYVYLCTGSGWPAAKCENLPFCYGDCIVLPDKFSNSTGGCGPDKFSSCQVFSDRKCTTKIWEIAYPGYDNFYSYEGHDYGHKAQAISCKPVAPYH